MVDRNSANIAYTFRFYVCLRLRDRDWCSTPDGNSSWYELTSSFFEEIIHRRHQNIAGIGSAMTRIDRNFIITKIYDSEIKQNLSKNIFLLLGCHHYDSIAHYFFSHCHLHRLLFSPTKYNFSALDPHRKTEIYIMKSFFVDSIYSKTIDIIRKNIFCFYF